MDEATADTRAPERKPMLNRSHDWELRVHLDKKLVFSDIVETTSDQTQY